MYSLAQTPEVELFAIVLVVLASIYTSIRWQPKKFYIIRHGRTLLNEAQIKQGPEGKLSPSGKKQAEQVGAYLLSHDIQRILVSPYERAQETAALISGVIRVPVTTTKLLRERKNPSQVLGLSTHDPRVQEATTLIDDSFHDDDYRYSDEENFTELKKRARVCLSLFERITSERVCVVTHHAFLKMLLASMVYQEQLHAGEFAKLSFFNPSDNGGISVCVFHPYRKFIGRKDAWEVLSYNEQIPLTFSKESWTS